MMVVQQQFRLVAFFGLSLVIRHLSCVGATSEVNDKHAQPVCTPESDPYCMGRNNHPTEDTHSSSTTTTSTTTKASEHGSCGLYWAPSTIPNAGLGLYTGQDLDLGTTVGEEDLFVTIVDKFKTLPYRGQQRFLSWLGYVYPVTADTFFHTNRNAFPVLHPSHVLVNEGLTSVLGITFVDVMGDPVNAFVPGIASMVNSHQEQANLDRDPTSHETEWDYPTSKPYTTNYGVTFQTTRNLPAGSELFLDYGDFFHERWENKYDDGYVDFEFQSEETINKLVAEGELTIPTEAFKREQRFLMETQLEESLAQKFRQELMEEAHRSTRTKSKGEIKKTYGGNFTHEQEIVVTTSTTRTTSTETSFGSTTHVETEISITTTSTSTYRRGNATAPITATGADSATGGSDKKGGMFPIGTRVLQRVEGSEWTGTITDYDSANEAYEVTFDTGQVIYYEGDAQIENVVIAMINLKDDVTRTNWQSMANQKRQLRAGEGETPHGRSLEWLQENGICLDNLEAGPSTIPNAGRGAYAKRSIPKDHVIAPAPLLALKREDLVIYEADEETTIQRNVLNFDKVVGQELLLNYCYGKKGSELLLVPYAPVVNFINHNGQTPNAMIRWPERQSLLFREAKEWLDLHPLDILDQSGQLMLEFVALRDISEGEEIFIDYGSSWQKAWEEYQRSDQDMEFRHEIEVPQGFYPLKWNQKAKYELANADAPLEPGEIDELRWAHNGKRVADGLLRVGLPKGFSAKMREYAEERGITGLYERLTSDTYLENGSWHVLQLAEDEQWFAQRYMNLAWKFNMHYVAAWDEGARQSVLGAMMEQGFNETTLAALGEFFGLNTTTCFHFSWMGLSRADNSFTHADVYGSGRKAYNLIYPIITVEGSKPELDIISDNSNIEIPVKYQYDVAYVLADWGYHKTSANDNVGGQLRLVAGTYCGQIDETNAKTLAYIYDGEDPAPFMSQFDLPIEEFHWTANRS